jgi:IS4 transposase
LVNDYESNIDYFLSKISIYFSVFDETLTDVSKNTIKLKRQKTKQDAKEYHAPDSLYWKIKWRFEK